MRKYARNARRRTACGDHRALLRLFDEERTVIEGAIQNPALSLERRAALRLRLLLEREGGLNGSAFVCACTITIPSWRARHDNRLNTSRRV